jgi:hypothetical protein
MTAGQWACVESWPRAWVGHGKPTRTVMHVSALRLMRERSFGENPCVCVGQSGAVLSQRNPPYDMTYQMRGGGDVWHELVEITLVDELNKALEWLKAAQ